MSYYLLDFLARYTKVHYVSELRNKALLQSNLSYIQSIPLDSFSLDDWKETCDYLMDDRNDITTVKDAKERLISWIRS